MFRAIILPIFRSTGLCVTACGDATGQQNRVCIIPQAVTHSLVLLKTGKMIVRNVLSWPELLISRYCCIWLVVYIIYINDARSSKYHIMKYIKSVFWRVAKRLSYIEEARCLKVKSWPGCVPRTASWVTHILILIFKSKKERRRGTSLTQ